MSNIKTEQNEKYVIDYYIYLDYSERLVGYMIIEKEQITNILPRITKLHHYKDIKHKKSYIQAMKNVFDKNSIKEYLLKFKIKELKDNLSLFADIFDFVARYNNCKIFASIDDNQFIAFSRLLRIVPHQSNITIVKESSLKKGSVEYKLSLIIDTILNIERVSK